MRDLKRTRAQIAKMASGLFSVVGLPFEKTSELQRQVLAAFAFGMGFAAGQLEELSPPEVHALALIMLMDVYHYSDHQAAVFAQELINSTGNRGNSTTNAIVHRGIEGHALWQQGELAQLKANLEGVFKAVKA
jgi:hypothetical protein